MRVVALERERAFVVFVDARYSRLHHLAVSLAGAQTADDVLHEALAKTYRVWLRRGEPDNPEAYVRRVMVRDVQRSWGQRRHDDLAGVDESRLPPAQGLPRLEPDEVVQLWTAVAALPVGQRTVVVLRYAVGLSEAETAAEMGCSLGTVKSQASRALAKLRTTLNAHTEGTS